MFENIALFSCFIFFYSLVCGKLEKTAINGALVFLLFGVAVGPIGLDLLQMEMIDSDSISLLAEITLAIVLFTDAANSNLRVLEKSLKIPTQLLAIGLPITIGLGLLIGMFLFPTLLFLEVAIIATILAPTDAALGKAVVTNKAVPASIREGLNVESGLNDGICVPILFILLALTAQQSASSTFIVEMVVKEVGIGVIVGASITLLAVWFLEFFIKRHWVTESWRQIPVIMLALGCYSIADLLGGSGFIACFSGGIIFNMLQHNYKQKLLLAAEGTGDTFALVTWVFFAALVLNNSFELLTWNIFLYSILSLTVIRVLPVIISLTGAGLSFKEKLFMGWFGPRGLASIVFMVIVLGEHLPHSQTISLVVGTTILLSIILHGLSANYFIKKLSAHAKSNV